MFYCNRFRPVVCWLLRQSANARKGETPGRSLFSKATAVKRPAFQFYTKDWQTNPKLRRCSPAARGVWMDVICLLHQSDEYGVLRWPLKDIASACGASMAHLRELVEKSVIKGGDSGCPPYIHTPKHAGKTGDPVVLLEATREPCWYSSRLLRDEWVRGRRGSNTRFGEDNQPTRPFTNQRHGERQGDKSGDGPPISNLQSTNPLTNPSGFPEGSGAAKPRPTRKCPAGFSVTAELTAWAAEKVPVLTAEVLERETEKFRDHTFGNSISDWSGAWRNWMRRTAEGRPVARANGVVAHGNKQEALEAGNRAIVARMIEKERPHEDG